MKIILNNFEGSTSFQRALQELIEGAETLSVAVSYLQVGGWEMFRERIQDLSLRKMRILCTDQLCITQPAAVKRALASKVQIRNFNGNLTYHPKVFLAHNGNGRPTRFLLGSANLSTSAFSNSIEAGVLSEDANALGTLKRWFDDVFDNSSTVFTPELLDQMELKWRSAAMERAKNRLRIRRILAVEAGAQAIPPEPEDVDTLEDVLATIQLPIGLLNIDYAGNNVRNVDKLREVLANPNKASGKQQSELKLLGFMLNGKLTALGRVAAAARTNAEVARLWCRWLKQTSDARLREINPRLLDAKRVLPQFWRLKRDVREYFLANARSPNERTTLQTIELLCNAREVVQGLSLDDIRTLSPLLQSERVPDYIREEVEEYFDNKGQRSWNTDDRRVIPLAWKEAQVIGE
jgi:HKD family nuclease